MNQQAFLDSLKRLKESSLPSKDYKNEAMQAVDRSMAKWKADEERKRLLAAQQNIQAEKDKTLGNANAVLDNIQAHKQQAEQPKKDPIIPAYQKLGGQAEDQKINKALDSVVAYTQQDKEANHMRKARLVNLQDAMRNGVIPLVEIDWLCKLTHDLISQNTSMRSKIGVLSAELLKYARKDSTGNAWSNPNLRNYA